MSFFLQHLSFVILVATSMLPNIVSAVSSKIYTPQDLSAVSNEIYTPQDLSAASNEINTRPRLCLTLVLKSMLPNIVSAASSKLLVENYFLMYVFS